jgi:hypothetical protein
VYHRNVGEGDPQAQPGAVPTVMNPFMRSSSPEKEEFKNEDQISDRIGRCRYGSLHEGNGRVDLVDHAQQQV